MVYKEFGPDQVLLTHLSDIGAAVFEYQCFPCPLALWSSIYEGIINNLYLIRLSS
jgi:hypothetical protein